MFIEIAQAATEVMHEVATEVVAEAAHEAAPEGVLGTLGINWKLFIAQLANFAIVLFVLWKWAWKPILKVLDDRSRRIEQSVNDAKRIEEEMKLLDKRRNDGLRAAEQSAQTIITEANASAKATREQLLAESKKEAAQVLAIGKTQLEAEKNRMVHEAKTEIADLVVEASEKVLAESMNDKRHRALVEKVLESAK
jgi:F-type H+-transporting ATPase subunit b